MNSNQRLIHYFGLSVLFCCLGCGRTPPGHVTVSGSVTLDGKPVREAVILFEPFTPDEGHRTSALVVEGEFHLEEDQGPSPGKYHVVLNPVEPDPASVLKKSGTGVSTDLADYRRLGAAIGRRGPITMDFASDQSNFVDVALTSR